MKAIIIGSAILVVIVLGAQTWIYASTNGIEKTKGIIVNEYDGFEIREYPEMILASTIHVDKTNKKTNNYNFRTLANYIFGGNEEEMKIAMTSPVQMVMKDDSVKMSFIMPEEYDMGALPKPMSNKVQLEKQNLGRVACIKFGGFASKKDFELYETKLNELLEEAGIQIDGEAIYLAYNPPFQVIGRRNEVVIPIKWD